MKQTNKSNSGKIYTELYTETKYDLSQKCSNGLIHENQCDILY